MRGEWSSAKGASLHLQEGPVTGLTPQQKMLWHVCRCMGCTYLISMYVIGSASHAFINHMPAKDLFPWMYKKSNDGIANPELHSNNKCYHTFHRYQMTSR